MEGQGNVVNFVQLWKKNIFAENHLRHLWQEY